MHGCMLSAVATDALVLKHQAISIHGTDLTFILVPCHAAKSLQMIDLKIIDFNVEMSSSDLDSKIGH